MTALALLSLAAAAIVAPGRSTARGRLSALKGRLNPAPPARRRNHLLLPTGAAVAITTLAVAVLHLPAGAVVGIPVGALAFLLIRRLPAGRRTDDPLTLASSWDLLAACLRGGLPVPDAVRAIAGRISGAAADALRTTADLIALGADPIAAWAPALAHPATAELARAARRTARSGAALADTAEALAMTVRSTVGDLAEARAQRAAVAVTGPLGLCFLPAFLCLGVVPVVIGLATRLMASW